MHIFVISKTSLIYLVQKAGRLFAEPAFSKRWSKDHTVERTANQVAAGLLAGVGDDPGVMTDVDIPLHHIDY